MRRWLSLLLLFVLPLQFGWSVAAAYCEHESRPEAATSARHLGHHEHEHKADSSEAAKPGAEQAAAKLAKLLGDKDCGYCHLGAAQPLQPQALALAEIAGAQIHEAAVPPLRTRDPDRRDRPNWCLFA